MSNTLTIDLDLLSEEQAQKVAGFILTYAGFTVTDLSNTVLSDKTVKVSDHVKVYVDPQSVEADFGAPSPSEVFGQLIPDPPSTLSNAGPQLVIPNPPSADATNPSNASIAQIPAQASQVAGSAAGIPASAAVSNASVSSTGVIVDKSGLPWDSRIHSIAKSINADGSWRIRRGLPEGYAEKIEAELRQLMVIPFHQSAASAVAASVPTTVANPSATANIPPPPLPPATASPNIQPYLDLMNKVSSALAGGKITQPQLQKVCDQVGLPNFVSLGTRIDLVQTVAPLIEGILAGNAV